MEKNGIYTTEDGNFKSKKKNVVRFLNLLTDIVKNISPRDKPTEIEVQTYLATMKRLENERVRRISINLFKGEEALIEDLINYNFFAEMKKRFPEGLMENVWKMLESELNIHSLNLIEIRGIFHLVDKVIFTVKPLPVWYSLPIDSDLETEKWADLQEFYTKLGDHFRQGQFAQSVTKIVNQVINEES
jgi:hypothetical protein